jgi:hypothetical protein
VGKETEPSFSSASWWWGGSCAESTTGTNDSVMTSAKRAALVGFMVAHSWVSMKSVDSVGGDVNAGAVGKLDDRKQGQVHRLVGRKLLTERKRVVVCGGRAFPNWQRRALPAGFFLLA